MNVLMLTLSWKANGTKIFSFHDVTNNNATGSGGISSATATNMPEEHVPDRFTICSSHKQQQIETSNTATIYVLYGDSNFSAKVWIPIQHVNGGCVWCFYLLLLVAGADGETVRNMFFRHVCRSGWGYSTTASGIVIGDIMEGKYLCSICFPWECQHQNIHKFNYISHCANLQRLHKCRL